jgi:hypothetical protein
VKITLKVNDIEGLRNKEVKVFMDNRLVHINGLMKPREFIDLRDDLREIVLELSKIITDEGWDARPRGAE